MKRLRNFSKFIFSLAVILLITAFVLARIRARRVIEAESASLAVGLRGNNRVSKPMSARQRDRFENYFLATPAAPQATPSSGVPSAVAEAQAVNAFNQRQNQ